VLRLYSLHAMLEMALINCVAVSMSLFVLVKTGREPRFGH
jgi:hypothetical protein